MFARLKVPSLDGLGNIVDHGVHAIVVPLRDPSGQCLPGVEIRDCGYKVTLTCHTTVNSAPLPPPKGNLQRQPCSRHDNAAADQHLLLDEYNKSSGLSK